MSKKSMASITHKYLPTLRKIAIELIDVYGANAINKVEACTPLERVVGIELRERGITNIRRPK